MGRLPLVEMIIVDANNSEMPEKIVLIEKDTADSPLSPEEGIGVS